MEEYSLVTLLNYAEYCSMYYGVSLPVILPLYFKAKEKVVPKDNRHDNADKVLVCEERNAFFRDS